MFELFLYGTFWFWALVASEIGLLFYCTRNERGWLATASLLIFGAALQWLGQINILGYVWGHPLETLGFAASYLLIGLGWATIKWTRLYHKHTDEYNELKSNFFDSHDVPPGTKVVPDSLYEQWVRHLQYQKDTDDNPFDRPLQIKNNKARWMYWSSLWCISVPHYFLGEFVLNIFNSMYKAVAGRLQAMADAHWAKSGIADDLKKRPTADNTAQG